MEKLPKWLYWESKRSKITKKSRISFDNFCFYRLYVANHQPLHIATGIWCFFMNILPISYKFWPFRTFKMLPKWPFGVSKGSKTIIKSRFFLFLFLFSVIFWSFYEPYVVKHRLFTLWNRHLIFFHENIASLSQNLTVLKLGEASHMAILRI